MTSEDRVYAVSPGPICDVGFVGGELGHLVPGNQGRMLDPRRTPLEVTEVNSARGSFVVRVCAFEDTGAQWELPLSGVGVLQFPAGARCASDREVARLRKALERFDRELVLEPGPEARKACLASLARRRRARRQLALGPAPRG